jgi:hypothetical protein
MCSLKSVFGISILSPSSINNNLQRILSVMIVLAAASAGASATPALSRISCASSSYKVAATDACSVYLTSTSSNRLRVTLTSNNSAVAVPASVTVRPGAISAGFSATVGGVTTTQSATITAQAGGVAKTFLITISPSTGTPALSVSGASIAFGGVLVNTVASQPLTLSSTGTAPVTVNSLGVSGSGFSVSGATLPATLNPGQSLTVNVQFYPANIGTFTGQLTISSNSPTAPALTVSLSGTGSPHKVELTWSAPSGSSSPVSGYKVYRAPASTSSFAVVDPMDTQTAYTDSGVQSGQSYKYYVTSVDSSGVESSPSNTTTVTVP